MSDNIIQFPGSPQSGKVTGKNADSKAKPTKKQKAAAEKQNPFTALGIPNLTADQEKAIQVVLSGMSFVCIGIKETDGGADFFTAVQGEAEQLRNAQPHLDGVIARAFDKKGI